MTIRLFFVFSLILLLLGTIPLKLVVVLWDSRHVKCQHSTSFNFQRRSYSTKIGNNAVVKIAACGCDSIQKFVYMTAASISPANTDEAMTRFLMDMETTQGKFYVYTHITDITKKLYQYQICQYGQCSVSGTLY